jgi:uncharacterized protein (TIGR00730 family)
MMNANADELLSSPKVEPICACVFGSSSNKTSQAFLNASFEMGKLLAQRGHGIVTGGGAFGCMQGVQSGCRQNGGTVRGVVHQQFIDGGSADLDNVGDMIIAKGDDLEERKRLLMDNAHCLLVCPGGVGTFDEFWDCVSHRSLDMKGLTGKPIIVLNIDGYYDGFVAQLDRASKEKLLYNQTEEYFAVATSPAHAVQLAEQGVALTRSGEMSSAWVNAMSAQRKAAAASPEEDKQPISNGSLGSSESNFSFFDNISLVKSFLFWSKTANEGNIDCNRRRERNGIFAAGACWGVAAALVAMYIIPQQRKK